MTVKPLTKEQKLDIVSKAIDAGAHVQIYFHTSEAGGTATPEEAADILKTMHSGISDDQFKRFTAGIDENLEAVIIIPQAEPIEPEWKDTGDMEEANA